MAHWSDVYPHEVYACVLLLDGKIYNWKIGEYYWSSPYEARMRLSDFDKIDRMKTEYKSWTVYNDEEHNEVFERLAKEWFKQWEIHENHVGAKAY